MKTKYLHLAAILLSVAVLFSTVPLAFGSLSPIISSQTSVKEGIATPVRLASDLYGNIFVADPRGGGVLKLSNNGKLLKKFSGLRRPFGIAVTASNMILVSQGTYISVLDANGAETKKFGTFKKANGIALDSTGAIYVTDSEDNCVQVFDASL